MAGFTTTCPKCKQQVKTGDDWHLKRHRLYGEDEDCDGEGMYIQHPHVDGPHSTSVRAIPSGLPELGKGHR